MEAGWDLRPMQGGRVGHKGSSRRQGGTLGWCKEAGWDLRAVHGGRVEPKGRARRQGGT
ncbi:hypothetical protein DPMN_044614 [Dreissena polymorpha]|uniref:Uncharacterized protein n=1 Tax=Dreissena polymorpha TaxID=45954 RepID=A0A9D4I0N2_DREPO|nr:hypothetical protein DPMN_044614 [Dreissena polymorpha]